MMKWIKKRKKNRKRKIDNIEDSERPSSQVLRSSDEPETKPRKKRAVEKPRKQPQQQEQPKQDIPIIYYI